MSGITRIKIISNWHDWRTELAEKFSPTAGAIYRDTFYKMGIELADGNEAINCTKDEAKARYDWSEGIDVILTSVNGDRMTLQEKFLTFSENTATFEEQKTNGEKGAWYYCTAQYYFIGYARKYWDWKNRKVIHDPVIEFQEWILIDFPAIRRASAIGLVQWSFNENAMDGRKASFRFVNFQDIPADCIIAGKRPYCKQLGMAFSF